MGKYGFTLETTTFTSGGSMDENGRCQLTKRFIYTIDSNTVDARRSAILNLENLVPHKGSCMSDDCRYTLKSANWNCLNWTNQSTKFYIDATYRRASDDEEAGSPWNLDPFGITFDPVEQDIPFDFAFDDKNERKTPVVNSSSDPYDAKTREVLMQTGFSFYAKQYDINHIFTYSNSVNSKQMSILGQKYAAGTLFLLPFQVIPLVTYEDDGYTPKWKYFQINMSLRYREAGWERVFKNIGNRARFNGNTEPELIYQFYPFNTETQEFDVKPKFVNAAEFKTHDAAYRTWWKENPDAAKKLPTSLPYEYGEDIPLTEKGEVDIKTIQTDITSKEYTGYPTRKFNEFKTLSWAGLDLPSELKKKWR